MVDPKAQESLRLKPLRMLAMPLHNSTDTIGRVVRWKSVKTDLLDHQVVVSVEVLEAACVAASVPEVASVAAVALVADMVGVEATAAVVVMADLLQAVSMTLLVLGGLHHRILSPTLLLLEENLASSSTFATYASTPSIPFCLFGNRLG